MRGARIAAAAAETLFDVTVVLGGERPAGIDFGTARVALLPPVKAGPAGFSKLVSPDGQPFGEARQADRRDTLLRLFAETAPDILLIEAFPFGRRVMRFELMPLLETARAGQRRPLIASSIRDILQESRHPGRDAEAVDLVRRAFDSVFVHGDPRLVALDASFPPAARIADQIVYTGLVGPAPGPSDESEEAADVIVSVGGGAVGAALIEAALAARPLSSLRGSRWLVLTGPNLPAGLTPVATDGVVIRPFVTDLPARLRRARLSISQAGYNTVADLLTAPRCRAVLVPYADGGETEQTRRAALMAAAGRAVAVSAEALTPAALAAAIDRALDRPECAVSLAVDGAARTATLLRAALDAHARRLA